MKFALIGCIERGPVAGEHEYTFRVIVAQIVGDDLIRLSGLNICLGCLRDLSAPLKPGQRAHLPPQEFVLPGE